MRTLLVLAQLPLWLLLGLAGWGLNAALARQQALQTVAHASQNQVALLDTVLQQSLEMQGSVRGFVLVGREQFLEPYRAARAILPGEFGALLTASAPGERARIERIRALLIRWLTEVAEPEIAARRAGATAQAVTLVQTGTGEALIGELRREVSAFRAEEADRLAGAEAELDRHLAALRLSLFVAAVLALVGSLFTSVLAGGLLRRGLSEFSDAAARIAGGERMRLNPPALREFRPLAAAFTRMSRQLGVARERERRRAAALQQLSVQDPLTRLGNRRLLEGALALPGPAAMLLIDIDHFKRFNDTFGHDAGDVVLTALAREVHALTPAGATAVRLGGEEFCVLLPEWEAGAATQLADALRRGAARLSLTYGPQALPRVTVSIGVAVGERPGLLRAADLALYRAKDAGRDRVSVG